MSSDRSGQIRDFILGHVTGSPKNIARLAEEQFGITRQAVSRHINRLTKDGLLEARGQTRAREYSLKPLTEKALKFSIADKPEEHVVWREHVAPLLRDLKTNVRDVCEYGFTEIFNNAVEHSEGNEVGFKVTLDAIGVSILIWDDGVGVFNKIAEQLHLSNLHEAILELSKGKVTTDPSKHTGEGIFFTMHMFEEFVIISGGLAFFHHSQKDDWLIEASWGDTVGTKVTMRISSKSTMNKMDIFNRFTTQDDLSFNKTHVAVRLATYGDENLISRSSARRVLARFDRFREAMLDFEGVKSIGQAFADEIFRVFRNERPLVKLLWVNENEEIRKMINRVIKGAEELPPGNAS